MRRSPLKPSTYRLKRSPIRRRSKARQKLYAGERIPFVVATIEARPVCEIQSPECTQQATTVHERIKRSAGGAIVPGEKADAQGQVFDSCCDLCNLYVETHPQWSRDNGFVIRSWRND